MRISTNTIFAQSSSQVGSLQSQLARTQQQLSTNKRMLSAADDPIASARALEVTQSQSINTQYASNRANARSALAQQEVAVTGVQNLIQDVQTIAVAAGSGANSASDRATYANELQGRLEDLIALGNSADGNGGYLFAGYRSTTMPFVNTNGSVDYVGDQGQVQVQVSSARKLAINEAGSAIFMGVPTGNGAFVTAAGTGNGGAAAISAGVVTDPSKLDGHKYSIDFTVVAGSPTTYTVTDKSTVPPNQLGAAATYTSGAPVTVAGMQFEISGDPSHGDTFSLQPSQRQSLFTTLSNLITTLRAPVNSATDRQALGNGISEAIGNLNGGLDQVLAVRSSIGARQKELDTLDTIGSDADVQYATTLSGLQDLDLVSTISQFTQQQATLDAAQKTFKAVSSLSLFNYIG